MKDLATYHDQNRLIHETDRRFHAADMELSGGYIQVVPAVAKKLSPFVQGSAHKGALAWSEGQTLQAEALQDDAMEVRRLRGERWWISEWRRGDGLYQLKQLSPEEKVLSRMLLGPDGLPTDAFPRAQGRLADDNDAQMVAEVMACRGQMVITSNRVLVEKDVLNAWLMRNQNHWPGLSADKLLADVDPLYTRWWEAFPVAPKVLTRIVLNAYWPKNENAQSEEVMAEAKKGAEALERGHMKNFAERVLDRLRKTDTIREEIRGTRQELARKMRNAETRRRAILDERRGGKAESVQVDHTKDVLDRFEWER